jgi:hypothetical protein
MTAEPKKSKKSTKSEKNVKTRKKDELTLGKRSLDTPMPKGAALYRSEESIEYNYWDVITHKGASIQSFVLGEGGEMIRIQEIRDE